MKGKKSGIGPVVVFTAAGAAYILFGGVARGDTITMTGYAGLVNQYTTPVNLKQKAGASEGYNPGSPDLDSDALPLQEPTPPEIPGSTRLVSVIPGHELSTDTRDFNSMTDFKVIAETIGAVIGQDNYWHFFVNEDTGDSFYWKNIFAERYGLDDINDSNNIKAVFDVKYISNNDVNGIGQGWVISGTVPTTSGVYDQFKIKPYNHADLNRDQKVNFLDFAIFASRWRATGIDKGSDPTALSDYADIDGNGDVNEIDLKKFSEQWLCDPNTIAKAIRFLPQEYRQRLDKTAWDILNYSGDQRITCKVHQNKQKPLYHNLSPDMIKGLAKNNNGELEQKLQNDNHNHEPRWARNHYNNHNTIDKLAKLQGPTSRFSLNTKQYKRSA